MKFEYNNAIYAVMESPSTRRVWIEIAAADMVSDTVDVTLHAEGVD